MRIAILLLLLASGAARPETLPDDPRTGVPPLNAPDGAPASAEALELVPLEITGEPLTFEQEVVLRFVRRALDTPRSMKREHWDQWVCWFDRPVGTRHHFLSCARNGDLWAQRPREGRALIGSRAEVLPPTGEGGYGTILTATRPVIKAKFKELLAQLPGSADFDREFAAFVETGQRPPRDIPSDDELDRFTQAWREINRLSAEGADDAALESAIVDAGLDVDRFNRIAELTQVYQSVENEVAVRLKRANRR